MASDKKMRIFVECPADLSDEGGGQPASRYVVPILPSLTVANLRDEIARRQNIPPHISQRIVLTLADGSLLSPSDEIDDVLQAGETVLVRLGAPQLGTPKVPSTRTPQETPISSTVAQNIISKGSHADFGRTTEGQRTHYELGHGTKDGKRVKIAFVTPELARNGGKREPAKVMAFDGSSISVNLTMDIVRQEAARSLGFMDVDDSLATSSPGFHDSVGALPRHSCSCTVACQISTQGRFEQLHCPKEIDGTKCGDSGCSYSHLPIASGVLGQSPDDLVCTICAEVFGFPCEKCLQATQESVSTVVNGAIARCPLVQNAGCKHIFHAHCYFSRASTAQGCPAGCPRATVTAEAVPFGSERPHLLVVHSGNIVDKVYLPGDRVAENEYTEVQDSEVIVMLEQAYPHLGPGLSVRMFDRKNNGLLRFWHSTIVSICCVSRHEGADALIRFPMNGPRVHPAQLSVSAAIDLHTWCSPVFNESPMATIEDLGLDENVENGGEIILYVIQREGSTKQTEKKRVGKEAVYTSRDDWYPSIKQTDRGMAAFLSSLLVFANYLSFCNKDQESKKNMLNRTTAHLLALTRFPPAARALYILTINESLVPEEIRALSETMYHLALDVAHPLVTKGDTSRVFEGARLLFGMLIERSKGPFVTSTWERVVSTSKPFTEISLACELSGEPLRDPVLFGGLVVERSAAELRQPGGALFDPSDGDKSIQPVPEDRVSLIRRMVGKTLRLIVLDGSYRTPPILMPKLTPRDLAVAINMANVELQMHAPLSLQQVVTPVLTLDEAGFNSVFVSRGGPCALPGEDVYLLRPCHGGEQGVDVNALAVRLESIIEERKKLGEWDVDAFGGTNTDRLDTREVEEAVVIALDLSRSMEEDFDRSSESETDEDEEEWEDSDDRAYNNIKNHFNKRKSGVDAAVLSRVKEFLRDLDCLPSITRYICYGEPRAYASWWTPGAPTDMADNIIARRRGRAMALVHELSVIFSRLHWLQSQEEGNENSMLRGFQHNRYDLDVLENFVIAAEEDEIVIDYLLEHVARIKEESYMVGGVPAKYLDPLTGKILVDPVTVAGMDGYSYERSSIEAWRSEHDYSPMHPMLALSKALQPLIPNRELNMDIVRFLHGRPRAAFPSSPPIGVSVTDEMGSTHQYVALPGARTVLSILIDEWLFSGCRPSNSELWFNSRDCGDGMLQGTPLKPHNSLQDYLRLETLQAGVLYIRKLKLDHCKYTYRPTRSENILKRSRKMSRLDIVKQAFEAFINKSEAFDHPIAIGLVTFGKDVREVQSLTLLKEQFRASVREVEADGDTPLYDSLSVAHSMLQSFKREHPSASLRIICLTDGHDIGSKATAHSTTAKLQRLNAIVDSIVVETDDEPSVLHSIAVATGDYSFRVQTLENALNIVELETVLRSKDRVPKPLQPLVQHAWQLLRYQNTDDYPIDIVTVETCPGRKPHAKLHQPVLSAQKVAGRSMPASTNKQKRLMQEIRDVVNSPHPAIDVYAGDDLAFWKIVIEAPQESPYAGGTFLAYVDFGDTYPQNAPEIRFVTPILHPNINRHGKVCHAALDRSWLVDMTMSMILQIVYGILLTPDTDNPLDLHATMEYNDDTGQHALKVHDMVKKFASKGREVWRRELEGI